MGEGYLTSQFSREEVFARAQSAYPEAGPAWEDWIDTYTRPMPKGIHILEGFSRGRDALWSGGSLSLFDTQGAVR